MMGNDNVAGFQYLTRYLFGSTFYAQNSEGEYKPQQSFYQSQTPNEDITWEKAQTMNVGIVANFLKYFSLEADYFKSWRRDILISRNASVPSYSGLSLPRENLGKVNNGGVEAILTYRQSKGDWNWGVSGNVTYAKNKIVYMDEAKTVMDWQRKEGHPIDSQLLYTALGIYQTEEQVANSPHLDGAEPGDIQYFDKDGDGEITDNDMIRHFYSATPRLMYGITLSAGWKGIDFSAFFQGQALAKQTFMPSMNMIQDFYDGRYIESDESTHASAKWPKACIKNFTYVDEWNGKDSTWWLRNVGFCRLKSVELGYTFPKKLINRAKIESLRVYVNGGNLFTIDKFKVADPEVGSLTRYPLQRTINFGVNISF